MQIGRAVLHVRCEVVTVNPFGAVFRMWEKTTIGRTFDAIVSWWGSWIIPTLSSTGLGTHFSDFILPITIGIRLTGAVPIGSPMLAVWVFATTAIWA